MPATTYWARRSRAAKLGPIPVSTVGATPAETRATCEAAGCPLLSAGRCYAWRGRPSHASQSLQRAAAADPASRTLAAALRRRHPDARAARHAMIGDPGGSPTSLRQALRDVSAIHRAGLASLLYTHGWRQPACAPLRPHAMASTETLAGARQAIRRGWIPFLVSGRDERRPILPIGGVRGRPRTLLLCPATAKKGVTCNACRLCDPTDPRWATLRAQGIAGIHNPEH